MTGMRYDFAIVGAGIAGASLAAELAPHASVLMLEAEDAARLSFDRAVGGVLV